MTALDDITKRYAVFFYITAIGEARSVNNVVAIQLAIISTTHDAAVAVPLKHGGSKCFTDFLLVLHALALCNTFYPLAVFDPTAHGDETSRHT